MRAKSFLIAAMMLGMTAPVLAADPVEVASQTFVRACLHHMGAYAQLRARLSPGQDLALPQLPPEEARPFLKGRPGGAWVRPDAGVVLALTHDDDCSVLIRKVSGDALYKRLEDDLRSNTVGAFTVSPGGRESKGTLLSRFIDLNASGSYRDELVRQYGTKIPGLRVIVTTSETANPNLQAIITLGTRLP